MTEQKIDAVKMTRSIRERNYERLRHLSRAERLAFYREQARLMNAKAATLVTAAMPIPTQIR
ncbi:MAG: hypothetical protein NT169_29000 [Chloroflexi bacterium]|nr:hypothetical protein [Chloroflexota bacterium]